MDASEQQREDHQKLRVDVRLRASRAAAPTTEHRHQHGADHRGREPGPPLRPRRAPLSGKHGAGDDGRETDRHPVTAADQLHRIQVAERDNTLLRVGWSAGPAGTTRAAEPAARGTGKPPRARRSPGANRLRWPAPGRRPPAAAGTATAAHPARTAGPRRAGPTRRSTRLTRSGPQAPHPTVPPSAGTPAPDCPPAWFGTRNGPGWRSTRRSASGSSAASSRATSNPSTPGRPMSSSTRSGASSTANAIAPTASAASPTTTNASISSSSLARARNGA